MTRLKIKAPSHGTCVAYLALFMAMGGTAAAATGGTFVLGRGNTATTQTALSNTGAGPVLSLSARTGQAPLAVGASAGKATNLNADKLDGLDSTQLVRQGSPINASALGGTTAAGFVQTNQLSSLQRRITGTCAAGQAVTAIASDGTVSCAPTDPQPVATSAPVSRDKGFAISDVQIGRDALGDWDGVARITNETSSTRTGVFTITIFRDSRIITTLRGSVNGLAPGSTNTVDFFSSDDFSDGAYTTSFQTDSASDG